MFARGTHTIAHCERCGFLYKLRELKEEWTGLKVCPTCFEQKHPQLNPKPHPDPVAVRGSTPDADDDGGVDQQLSDVVDMTFG